MSTLSLTKEARIYNGEKTASSVSRGKTGQHVKECHSQFFLTKYMKHEALNLVTVPHNLFYEMFYLNFFA